MHLPYICAFCQMGKSHKLPFANSATEYTIPFELITTDLWGSTPIRTDFGYRFYISFVDANSRYTWLYPLKSKSETYSTVQNFIKMVENQFNSPIKII